MKGKVDQENEESEAVYTPPRRKAGDEGLRYIRGGGCTWGYIRPFSFIPRVGHTRTGLRVN